MERPKYNNDEAAIGQVNHYEFKFPNIYQQDISGGDYDIESNKSEKEASFPPRHDKLIYKLGPLCDDFSTGYELEMEDTIVNLNDDIQKLHEELTSKNTSINVLQGELDSNKASLHELKVEFENKNASIFELKEELVKKSILLNEVHEELESKKTSINILQDELVNNRTTINELEDKLQNKIANIFELNEKLVKQDILSNETEKLKSNFNESVKRIIYLEQSLREKNEALELNSRLLDTVKMELDHESESAFLKEKELEKKEQEMRSRYENEIQKLKHQYSEQLKEVLDNYSLKEKFLEKQIDMLFNRIEELTERGETHQQEYETVKKMYEEEYNEMKSKVDDITKSSGSHIQELNNRLAASLSNEVALKVELKSKIDVEKKINQELNNTRSKYEELIVNENNLCKRLKKTETQLDLLKEEKEELKKQLVNANNLYEELNNNYNRDRKELLKKQKDTVSSYEKDLCNLIKALEDLYHCISTLYCNFNEELSYTESDESIINLPVVSKEIFSNTYCYGAMKIVCDSISESIKLHKEIKTLVQNYQNLRVAFDARKKACEENAQQMAALQSEIMTLDKEKECAVNNLRYIQEQNDLLKYDHLKKKAEIVEINNELMRYKDELDKLSQLQQQNETPSLLPDVDLSPIAPDFKASSDGNLAKDENMFNIQSRSLMATNKAVVHLTASTPCNRNICDPEGGGEFLKPKSFKSRNEVHLSLVKWMEKCHELDKQNKCLSAEVESLTVQLKDLQYSSQLLKEEMNSYEEMRMKLEQKLGNHLSLKQQCTELQDENEKLINESGNLRKEVDYLRNENLELSKKNVQMEEKYRKYLVELTENPNNDNNAVNNEAIINNFNEKVQEIIGLKGELRSLSDDKKYLTRKVDLLLEANNIYCRKIEETFNELVSCKNELEKIRNEKIDIYSENKLLSKEVQLLKSRLDFYTALRDSHRCTAGSLNQTEDLFQELIVFVKSIMENKLEAHSSLEWEDVEKGGSKADKIDLHEIIRTLNHQLNEEKLDFDGKLKELQHIINFSKNSGTISDDWVVQLDKKLRIITEEMKFHKEQYNRIEEALRSTGKLHDELQKNKDQLRVKDHEISNFQKKISEEKMQVKKCAYHVKYLQQELEQKNEIIKTSVDQKRTLEKELMDLQNKLYDAEKKYEMEIKAAEWKLQQAKLYNLENEVERKLIATRKGEKWPLDDLGSEKWGRVREEVERVYQNALQQVQYFFNAEVSSTVIQVQEEHKEQIAEFQRIIDEQAIKIGILMKKHAVEGELNNDPVYINEEYKKQFDLATYALQQLHQEEIQLLRLQLEAEKHFDIYKALYENQPNFNEGGLQLKLTANTYMDDNLTRKLESVLLEDFLSRFQKFISGWHHSYTKEVINIKSKLQYGIDEYLNEELNAENLLKTGNENQQILNQYNEIISSAKDFLFNIETEGNQIMKKLSTFVEIYEQKTGELFEQINVEHLESNELLVLQEELIQAKKEKEELEKMHKNAIELLNADHKTEQAKIQVLLTEIKQCFESGCDPNALMKIKFDLEERHRKELEDLRTYFEEKCANLGKQYSEDVNSLHSKMLSLSSSCSDDIMSDHIGFDRGGSGDNNFAFSEIEVDNVSTLEKLTAEQYKLIEELNYKWSENVKEMKKELEKKYSKKIEQLQEKLSTFVYNNELDVTVRCIQEDVMRDCKLEIEDIKKEVSSRLLASAEYSDDHSELSKNTKEQLAAAFCERDAAWELIVEVMGNSLSQDVINKITIEIMWDALKKSDFQEKLVSKVSELLSTMEDKLSVMSNKLKDKEIKLFNLQNKMNSCSQFCYDILIKLKNHNEINAQRKVLENSPQLLEKLIEGHLEEMNIPPDILQMKDVLQKLYEKKLVKEIEKHTSELETLKKSYQEKESERYNKSCALLEKLMSGEFDERDWPPEMLQIKNILQEMFDKKLIEEKDKTFLELECLKQLDKDEECIQNVCTTQNDELDRIIEERDNLKQMNITLKSAVSQLVSYLNTCEDELNKTVVEELLKIYVETPKKANSDYESLESTSEFKKVHFAPEVGISDLDSSQDISSFLRVQLDSCLSKLKVEAASLLGLTALQPPPANLSKQIENLRKENEELLQEVAELKIHLHKHQNYSLELRDQFADDLKKENNFAYLQDKAQLLSQNIPPEAAKILEDFARLGDSIIHELQKEKIDLQQQIDAADKQLKSTRQFLEEQAAERETERDDYSKEITNLQAQLKEKGKNLSSHERFTTEVLEPVPQKLGKISLSVEELEQQLKESNMHLEECEKKKGMIEAELKDAIDKVWVLREIISDLESQLTTKSEREALLEQKLDELETELEQQNGTQFAMAQELESLRSQSLDDGYLEQIKQLEENIKVQFNSSVVRQLKTQLRDLEKTLDHRTKELETVYLNNSSNSLSSPSEEVSVREQLEWARSRTPEQCPSPVSLPVEEVSKLHDKFLRHVRAEEMLIKRLRDQQLIGVKLQVELEEMHAEREVLQKQMKKQMVLLAEANNKIDDLRHKVETAQTAANKDLISQIQELKEKYSKAEQALDSTHNQLMEHKIQLSHAEEIISKQKVEISNLAHCDHEIVDSLRLELAAVTAERNKLEDLLDKYRRDFNLDVVNALLVDKNEDIDHLQHTVNMLQNQKEDDDQHGSCNSKGYRVSFAADIENSNSLVEEMRLRDAAHMHSLDLYPDNNFQVFGGSISPIPHEKEEKLLSTTLKSFSLSDESILGRTDNENENIKLLIGNLRSELQEKNDKIVSLEKEIEYLKSIEEDLKNTKSELQTMVSSVTEDKKYYEKEIHFMSEKLTKKGEEMKKLRNTMKQKDEEIIKTTADVQSLREISLNLQEKLREAKELAEKENVHLLKDELAHFNGELLSKEKEISELEHELQLFKADYNDEKELCETLKSSLNAISAEKQNLVENISSLQNENRNLVNDLGVAEDRLNQYVTAVRNLKNDLSSKSNTLETKYVSANSNSGAIEIDILTLQNEVIKLMNLNENLFEERNNILEELNKLKMTIDCEDYATKDSLISQLQDELNELKKAVLSVKEEKLSTFANFSKEICQLHKDIDNLKESKQEALQKWKQELLEKKALQEQFESLKSELEVEKCQIEQEKLLRYSKKQRLSCYRLGILEIPPLSDFPLSKVQKLTFCKLGNMDIQPVSEFPVGIDALADKMRKEIKLSATLDNSLLESILPENSGEYQGTSETSKAVSGQHVTITSRLRSLEKALLSEMEKAREARNGLHAKETKYRASEAEKNEMKLQIERLGRMLAAHEEKIALLLNQLKMQKDKVLTLELMVSKEQASLKQMTTLLEEERNKARESQKDDIALIETMRKRLQSLMENETILKQIVREERQKSNNLLAQLNSARALEQYRSDSEDENHKNCQKMLLQERDNYFQMKVECEKERRTCEDLREVLARERTALCYLQDSLAKSEKTRCHFEKEIITLKQKLNEEIVRRELADRRIVESQDIEDTKFQKHLQAIESRNKKSLDTAYAVIREIEQEYNDLKVYIRSQQEQDEKWKDQVHLPLIQQLNEVNDNLDALIKERVELKRTIDRLNEENNRLHNLIDELKRVTPSSERLSIPSDHLEVPSMRLPRGSDVLSPFIEREVDELLDRVLQAERHKKALVFQKRYLLVALRGYQDAHTETINQLRWHHLNRRRPRKFSFRSVAYVVIAAFKIRRLPLRRIRTYHKRREVLLNTIKRSFSRSTAEMERLTSAPPNRRIAPHSPPSRDRANLRFR